SSRMRGPLPSETHRESRCSERAALAKSRHHHMAEAESTSARINDAVPTSVRQITLSTAKIIVILRKSRTAGWHPFDGLEGSRRSALKNIISAAITALFYLSRLPLRQLLDRSRTD